MWLSILKEVAPTFGFGGYQALVRAYIGQGLRQHPAQMETDRSKAGAWEELSRRLMAHGVPEKAIKEAVAEMGASSL